MGFRFSVCFEQYLRRLPVLEIVIFIYKISWNENPGLLGDFQFYSFIIHMQIA